MLNFFKNLIKKRSQSYQFKESDKCPWLISADQYYIATRIIWKDHDIMDKSVSLYLASQAIERYLKAILAEHNRTISKKSHDLKYLMKECDKAIGANRFSLADRECIIHFNKLAAISRYPDQFMNYQWSDIDMWKLEDVVNKLRSIFDISTCRDTLSQFLEINHRANNIFSRKNEIQIGGEFKMENGNTEYIIPLINPVDALNEYNQKKNFDK